MKLPVLNHFLLGESSPETLRRLPGKVLLAGIAVLAASIITINFQILNAPVLGDDRPLLCMDNTSTTVDTPWIQTDWISASGMPQDSNRPGPGLLGWMQPVGKSGALTVRSLSIFCHLASAFLLWMLARQLRFGNAFLAALLFAVHPISGVSIFWVHRLNTIAALPFILLACLFYLRSLRSRLARWWTPPAAWMAAATAFLITPDAVAIPLLLAAMTLWHMMEVSRKKNLPATVALPGAEMDPDTIQANTSRRMPDELEHDEWKKYRPWERKWLRLKGNMDRWFNKIGFTCPDTFRGNWMWAVIALAPFIILCTALAIPEATRYIHHEGMAPDYSKLTPPFTFASLGLPGWCQAWSYSLNPLQFAPIGNLLTLVPGQEFGRMQLLTTIILLAILTLPIFVRKQWTHDLFLLTAFSLAMLTPRLLFMQPQTETALVSADTMFYWFLPVSAILVGAVLASTGRWLSIGGSILALLLAMVSLTQYLTLRDTDDIRPLLYQQCPNTPLGLTAHAHEFATKGNYQETENIYEKILGINPIYAPAWDGYGQAAFQQEDYYLAIERFSKAVQYAPKNPNYQLRLIEAGRWWNAVKYPQEALLSLIHKYPNEPEPYNRLAISYLASRMHPEALRYLNEAVKLAPKNQEYLTTRGLVYLANSNLGFAQNDIRTAMQMDAHRPLTCFAAAWMELETPNGKTIPPTLQLPQNSRYSRLEIAFQILSLREQARRGNRVEAEKIARNLSLEYPNDCFAQLTAARILLLHPNTASRSPQIALWILQRAAKQAPAFPRTPYAWMTMAIAHNMLGDTEQALNDLSIALKVAENAGNQSECQRIQSYVELLQNNRAIGEYETELFTPSDLLLYALRELRE